MTRLFSDFVNTLCKVLDILARDSSNRNTSIFCQIDGKLLHEAFNLCSIESSECKHSNLRSDVAPWFSRLESVFKMVAVLDECTAIGHA
jgi:hypothetical protein